MANDQKYMDDELALKDFLLDIECLEPLSEWTGKLNFFDILKITRVEIRHSNMLAWLINPNENHGLNDQIIRGFIQYVVTSFSDGKDVISTLLMDCHNFSILREWRNIDILAVSTDNEFLICIENKVDSSEHDDQLKRYRHVVEEEYPHYKKMYIYLSPDGFESSEPDYWCSMGYPDVISIIENCCKRVKLVPESELLINNYVETIRRDIVGDERLAQICKDIYTKHQRALDLIFDNKPDRASDVAEIIREWALQATKKGEIEVVLEKCNKTYTRFLTSDMSQILPDAVEAQSGWNTKNHYFYEIFNNGGNEFHIQFVLSARSIPSDLKETCERINGFFPSKQNKTNWLWRTVFSTRRSKIEDDFSDEVIVEGSVENFV